MTRRSSPGFLYSDRDVAALVHGLGEDPAALLLDFTRDLAAQGVVLAGPAVELLVIDRFGASTLDILAQAAEHDIPVLVALPEALFPTWLDMTGGLAVRLPCSRFGLERWWRSLGTVNFRPPARQTLCERVK